MSVSVSAFDAVAGPATTDSAQAAHWLEEMGRAAAVRRTACGPGQMTWRCWGRGEPLVLLHGGGGSWQHWVRNIGPLSATREVWCPDLPAFGDSDDPPGEGSVHDIARATLDGLDALFGGDRAVDVAGFSFGGIIATLVAAARPGRVDRLVVVGSTALGLVRQELKMRIWRKETEPSARRAAHLHNLRELMVASRTDDALALAVHSANVERARFNGRTVAQSTLLRDTLPSVRARVTGIWGSLDATALPDVRRARDAMLPGCPSLRFEVVEGSGHWVQYESADRFNALMAEVLAD